LKSAGNLLLVVKVKKYPKEDEMWVGDVLFALFVALLLTAIFAGGFRRSGPWTGFIVFFIIIFLASWAGGIWIGPIGSAVFGIFWIPFVFAGLIFALLLAAVVPARPMQREAELKRKVEEEIAARKELDAFFWILVGLLILAVILGYVYPPETGLS
jgi:hypothetical protein